MTLTREQTLEVDKAITCLKEARGHLDNAMYHTDTISDEDYSRLRQVYQSICEIQDRF